MFTRRDVLEIAALAIGTSASAVFAEEKQEKKDNRPDEKPRPGPAGDRDGKNDVRGAIWEVTAVNAGSKKKEVFRFRHQNGVLFNNQGKKIGVVSKIGQTKEGGVKDRLVLQESTPLIGEMIMTNSKKGVWSGTLKTKEGVEWNCVVKVLDR